MTDAEKVASLLRDMYGPGWEGWWNTYVQDGITQNPVMAKRVLADLNAQYRVMYGGKEPSHVVQWAERRIALDEADIPQGRYALTSPSNEWEFYAVDHVGEHYVVARLIGSPREFRHEPVKRAWAVLKRIQHAVYEDKHRDPIRMLTGPYAAAVAYGREHRCCSVCQADLSDPVSVELAMGPYCRKHFAHLI